MQGVDGTGIENARTAVLTRSYSKGTTGKSHVLIMPLVDNNEKSNVISMDNAHLT